MYRCFVVCHSGAVASRDRGRESVTLFYEGRRVLIQTQSNQPATVERRIAEIERRQIAFREEMIH
jgi:hypothetical protein